MTAEFEQPSLSRAGLDRAGPRRIDPDLVARLLADPASRVLALDGDRTPVREEQGEVRLALRPAADLPGLDPAEVIFLGEDADGRPHLLARGSATVGPGEHLATLREVGATLDDAGSGMFTAAVALANWHATHPRCSRCGEPTDLATAGWSRHCPACGAEHQPRTDPAVIMTVVDPDDRLLLGHQAVWPEKRFSTLAGFVEPGESLEQAVRREVAEEAGVRVGRVVYRGSQPWPFPASLMVGFTAHAVSTDIVLGDDELGEARWWTREQLGLDVATEELLLPPPVSIARRLIEQWYGGPIRDGGGAWR